MTPASADAIHRLIQLGLVDRYYKRFGGEGEIRATRLGARRALIAASGCLNDGGQSARLSILEGIELVAAAARTFEREGDSALAAGLADLAAGARRALDEDADALYTPTCRARRTPILRTLAAGRRD